VAWLPRHHLFEYQYCDFVIDASSKWQPVQIAAKIGVIYKLLRPSGLTVLQSSHVCIRAATDDWIMVE